MCYHNTINKKPKQIKDRYQVEFPNEEQGTILFHENGFAHLPRPVITAENPNEIQLYTWGLIPSWFKTYEEAIKFRNNTLNAVSEKVFETNSYRGSIAQKRCIIPSTGFFEWHTLGKNKFPYFIHLKSEEIFSMAGIYNHWTDKQTNTTYHTFSILTCPANTLMANIHNSAKRMPVILPKEIEKDWLKTDLTPEEIKSFFLPYPDDDMQAHTISKKITSRSEPTNVAEITLPVSYPELNKQTDLF